MDSIPDFTHSQLDLIRLKAALCALRLERGQEQVAESPEMAVFVMVEQELALRGPESGWTERHKAHLLLCAQNAERTHSGPESVACLVASSQFALLDV